jgi:hypothetical protein
MQTVLTIRVDGNANQASLIRAAGLVLGNVMAGGRGIDAGDVQFSITEHGTLDEICAADEASRVRPMKQGALLASSDFIIGGDMGGTSLQGYLSEVPYKTLVKLFGQPDGADGHKVDACWTLTLRGDHVVTIYNWKNGKNYCGAGGTAKTEMVDWHVGGSDPKVVKALSNILERFDVPHSYTTGWGAAAAVTKVSIAG